MSAPLSHAEILEMAAEFEAKALGLRIECDVLSGQAGRVLNAAALLPDSARYTRAARGYVEIHGNIAAVRNYAKGLESDAAALRDRATMALGVRRGPEVRQAS